MITGKDILETSKVVLLFGVAYKKYRLFEERLYGIYENSLLCIKTKIIFNAIIVISRYSFL